MADLPPLVPLPEPIDAAALRWIRARETTERLWAPVLPDATRRLLHDPLLVARARSTAALIREDRRGRFAGAWSEHDQALAEWAAAVALVIAERPELITGTPSALRPPVDVLARMLDPLVRVYSLAPLTDGHREAQGLARRMLEALEAAGHDVVPRADRFPHLDTERPVRIPLRGRCGSCRDEVTRGFQSRSGELLVGAWQHVVPLSDMADVHDPADVETR